MPHSSRTAWFQSYEGLHFLGGQTLRDAVEGGSLEPVLAQRHRFAGHMQTLVDAALPEEVLLDRGGDGEAGEAVGVVATPAFPLGGRDDLNKMRGGRRAAVCLCKERTFTIPYLDL